jgi:hypothetical protein
MRNTGFQPHIPYEASSLNLNLLQSWTTARNAKAAAGAEAEQLSIALRLVLQLENVEYQMEEAAN